MSSFCDNNVLRQQDKGIEIYLAFEIYLAYRLLLGLKVFEQSFPKVQNLDKTINMTLHA